MKTSTKFDLLTRVEGDAPMGRLMRRYWTPVLQSNRLEPDGAPLRLRILGEDLVAFRGTDGKVCLMAEGCPHRGVSLALARNEDCGLRCVMHGWKIDTSGKVVQAENLGPSADLTRIDTGFRPTLESSGLVWAWFGGCGRRAAAARPRLRQLARRPRREPGRDDPLQLAPAPRDLVGSLPCLVAAPGHDRKGQRRHR